MAESDLSNPSVDPGASRLKSVLERRRSEIRAMHAGGASGQDVCTAQTHACDNILRRAYTQALDAARPSDRDEIRDHLALVAVGGYGRCDLAPCSDIDLLFLLSERTSDCVPAFVSSLVRCLWDIGLKLSQSVRTAADCIRFAGGDLAARTSLFEARFLAGRETLYTDLRHRVHRMAAGSSLHKLIDEAVAERRKEHKDYHSETVYLLEPNVKKSPGGLRDYHVLRWVALTRYGTHDTSLLQAKGYLSSADAAVLAESREFLFRLRNEMHYHAGTAQDVLTRDEQVRLAAWLGYETQGALLGVERFMQQYYRLTTGLHELVDRFVERSRKRTWIGRFRSRLLTQRAGEHILYHRDCVALDDSVQPGNPMPVERILHLFELARGFGVPVEHRTFDRIRDASPACVMTSEVRSAFFEMLANPNGLGSLLRNLHRVELLERLLPPFAHARCLIQFNLMHKYTVDEHTLRAVEAATRRIDDPGPLGRAYREIRRKDLLHLALLLHDLGKGFEEDHCVIGRRLAEFTAEQYGLNAHDRGILSFLVHKHLLMVHTAFRRNLDDIATIVQFTRTVGTPEALRMLYVMSAADTEAVAPGEFTVWKESLLTELYGRVLEELTGEKSLEVPVGSDVGRLPYILSDLRRGDVKVEAVYMPEMAMMRYTVATHDDITPGLFSKIAGVLTASGIRIVNAQIVTRPDDVVLDVFDGTDLDFTGEPPAGRREEIAELIRSVLLGRQPVERLIALRSNSLPRRGQNPVAEPPEVAIDNDTSERFTIVEVFAHDRLGLLYAITRAMFEMNLSIHSAKISTHYDQIVDVFYVTSQDGARITDAARLEEIRRNILESIS